MFFIISAYCAPHSANNTRVRASNAKCLLYYTRCMMAEVYENMALVGLVLKNTSSTTCSKLTALSQEGFSEV